MTHEIKRFQPFFIGLEIISLKGRRRCEEITGVKITLSLRIDIQNNYIEK